MGVFADSPLQPRWLLEALARLAGSDFAEIAYVCVIGDRPLASRGKRGLSPDSPGPLIWDIYRSLDAKMFGSAWSQPCSIASLVPASQRLGADTLADHAIDVAVAVGDVPDAAIATFAPCGVWRYCFGESHDTFEPNAGVREVLDGDDVTGCGVRVLRHGRGPRLAYESWSRTLRLSVARSRDNVFAKATRFLVRSLAALHREGPSMLDSLPIIPDTRGRRIEPDTARMAARLVKRAIDKATTVEQWSLAFRFVDIEPWNGSLAGFHRLVPPRDRFWADPFPLQRNGKSYIFFEELPFAAGRAHISVVEVDRDGRASEPVRVLERDYHLSYPFLVEDGGQLYMVPETAGNDTIEIYRCVDFPRKWRRERVLVDGVFAADATLHRADGRWWMFANLAARGAEIHDELHIFTSDALLGDWTPIAANPVKSDVRCARPAGKLFTVAGRLYRPAQICAPLYGAGISLQRVTRVDEAGLEEQEERRIVPAQDSGILGLHTINRAGDLSVIDAFARRARL